MPIVMPDDGTVTASSGPAFAETADVVTLWGPLSLADESRATGLLQYASSLIRQAVPGVDGWVEAGTLDRGLVRFVAATMVHRVFLNSDLRRQVSQSIDDYTESWTVDAAAGQLMLTDAELASLAPVATTASTTGAFTIRPGAQ